MEILLVTGDKGFFGQTRKPWVSMNSELIVRRLEELGHIVEKIGLQDMVNADEPVRNKIIFYTFSQKPNIRQYIKDMIAFHEHESNLIIPRHDLLLCHENKGYQELFKKKLGIKSLDARYYSSLEQVDFAGIRYPVVLKATEGSNGTRVFMIHDESELADTVEKKLTRTDFSTRLDLFRRKIIRSKKSYPEYPDYSNKTDLEHYAPYIAENDNFILQELVPDRDCDYRILALGNKYFAEKRLIRKNDFRASGSKMFVTDIEIDKKMLEFARNFKEKTDTPFISLDICERNGEFYLIEFQGLHFGINVVMKTKGYYDSENNWNFSEHRPEIERYIAEGLDYFLVEKFNESNR